MSVETIFFDLDATLYPESNGLWPAIRRKIDLYMLKKLNIPETEIPQLREYYYIHYGTTLRGLQIHYNIDAEDYLNYVHDIALHNYLQPNPDLRKMLLSIPKKRWVFTNSDLQHAERVMSILGVEDCFDGIVDVYAMQPFCKPNHEAYEIAMVSSNSTDPKVCALIDDSIRNLTTADEMGFFTVWVGNNNTNPTHHRTLIEINDLPKIVNEFWD